MNKLLETLKEDCEVWVSSKATRLFMNECDMQVRLAKYLEETKNYGTVYVEYSVPLRMLGSRGFEVPEYKDGKWSVPDNGNFPWPNQMHIDLMVEKDGKFAAVELKYSPALVDEELSVFGEPLDHGCEVIKYQGAQDMVMYGYWKDVRRIEALTRFENMVGGVALIVSNDKVYWEAPKPEAGYSLFSTHEKNIVGVSGTLLAWKENISKVKDTLPAFRLDRSYACIWKDTAITAHCRTTKAPFRYMINVIEK